MNAEYALKSRYSALANRRRLPLQQDNAPAHTVNVTQRKLVEFEWLEVMSQLAYSSDFASSDNYNSSFPARTEVQQVFFLCF